jgi:hypothetical protein
MEKKAKQSKASTKEMGELFSKLCKKFPLAALQFLPYKQFHELKFLNKKLYALAILYWRIKI